MTTSEKFVRWKKASSGNILGPMPVADLIELAGSALVSPEDEFDEQDEQWRPVYELEELEMVWTISTDDGEYGPTTIGTVKEFFVSGEINADTIVTHSLSGEEATVQSLLGTSVVSGQGVPTLDDEPLIEEEQTSTPHPPHETPSEAVLPEENPPFLKRTPEEDDPLNDTQLLKNGEEPEEDLTGKENPTGKPRELARDLRIRQLEQELAELQASYDNLLQQFRKVTTGGNSA